MYSLRLTESGRAPWAGYERAEDYSSPGKRPPSVTAERYTRRSRCPPRESARRVKREAGAPRADARQGRRCPRNGKSVRTVLGCHCALGAWEGGPSGAKAMSLSHTGQPGDRPAPECLGVRALLSDRDASRGGDVRPTAACRWGFRPTFSPPCLPPTAVRGRTALRRK
jgi:hypothetical protein